MTEGSAGGVATQGLGQEESYVNRNCNVWGKEEEKNGKGLGWGVGGDSAG